MSGWWAASYALLWALVAALCVIAVALARQIGVLNLRLGPRGALEIDGEGPPLGEAPGIHDATDLAGRPVRVGGPGRRELLLFVSPTCPLCEQVLPGLAPASSAASLDAIVIVDAGAEQSAALLARRLRAPIVAGPEIASRYRVPGTPYAVVLDELGVVRAKGTVNTLEQLEGLIDTAVRRIEDAREMVPG